ncbi:DNA-binding LacI/PurR family transcriptional regulator [Saccharothrix ecbatanensis]|uniref:DNA-binding LacI/PurR family transcriptional regulator n=1 Tax=Saccharothrix ecbatanensis TaxID=1105145 RepID=A0A7W9HG17_9PSEU|nr:LacI family DNA-binding transcriptional regulator [Saccharothrix ecbatanensis]MBB5801525.1 DNA-binding LacI/PurR family transcriptional regulator [Saccharothrix ecbatanensis]
MVGKQSTLADVARAAGVSLATASRVLSGRGPASNAARQRVAAAASELHYVPHAAARALATRIGTRIAVVVGGQTAHVLNDPYVGRVVTATAEVAAAREVGVSLHWLPLHDPAELGRLAEHRGIGGIILINPTKPALDVVPRSVRGRIAAIGIGSRDVPSFDVDNAAGTANVVAHLVAGGRRKVAMITGAPWLPCTERAVAAYHRVVDAAGTPPRLVPGDFTAARGEAAAVEIMTRWPDTDAVYALGDLSALGALNALRRAGVDVPGDVAVAGFDDIAFAALSRLTTTTHPVEDIAAGAATAVLDRRNPGPLTRYPSTLVLRESA